MARYLIQHQSGDVWAATIDADNRIAGSRVMHWSDWSHGDGRMRDDITLFDIDLETDFDPYPDTEYRYIAEQTAPDAPVVDLR